MAESFFANLECKMIERRSFKPLSVWDGDNFRLRSRASTATLTHAGTTWKCRALKTSQYGKAIGQPHLVTLMLWLRVEATIIKFRREMFFPPLKHANVRAVQP
jgi:hypothetical protein